MTLIWATSLLNKMAIIWIISKWFYIFFRYLASASLDQLSEEMLQDWKRRLSSDTGLQNSIQDRQHLPVYAMKASIMEAINEHPVIIIRGNTGCGKYQWRRLSKSNEISWSKWNCLWYIWSKRTNFLYILMV